MRHIRNAVACGVLFAGVAGCDNPLEVGNPNDPDRPRVLANPTDVESLGGGLYQQITSGTTGNIARVQTGLMSAALMNGSALANNGLGPRGEIPRGQIDNTRGNTYLNENYNDFRILQQTARAGSDVLARATAEDFTLGAAGDTEEVRLISWTYFAYGLALGYTAMVYDSAAIPRPTDAPADLVPLSHYSEVMAYALEQLDLAEQFAGEVEFTLPSDWLRGNALTSGEFQRVIRSFRARLRAGVARTPVEREAVDWAAVIADATGGLEDDLLIAMNPAAGFDVAWLASTLHYRDANWHQMPYYIIGMADTSGAYEAWLNEARDSREPFLIKTPDTRFPSGETRAEQNAVGQAGLPDGVYYRNRAPGLDQALEGWRASYYDHFRFWSYTFVGTSRANPFPVFTKTENDMLAAEGYLREGQPALAIPLINASRTAHGLPAIPVGSAATDPVPGGASCVPQVPTASGVECGDVFEAMKWEKRMETAYTSYGAWYFDSRGWGDLPEGTFLSMPVPYQELDARRLPLYTLGGVGGEGAAEASTYGFGTGNR